MANHGITGSITLKSGQVYANALVRVTGYTMSGTDEIDENRWCVHHNIWRSEASYDAGEGPAENPGGANTTSATFATYFAKSILDDAGKDPYTASYLFLKNEVSRYSGFTDV